MEGKSKSLVDSISALSAIQAKGISHLVSYRFLRDRDSHIDLDIVQNVKPDAALDVGRSS